MKNFTILTLLLLAVSCNGTASSDMPEWRWDDPDTPETPATTEPHPALVEAGWSNISTSFSGLPEGLCLYRSPDQLAGVKTVAYIAVADLSRIRWDVRSINDPQLSGTSDALKTPSEWYKETSAPVILNGGYFYSEGGKRYNASVAVSGGQTYGVNINYASQDWKTIYYPTRGVFYQNADAAPAVGWTYWAGAGRHYLYGTPADNTWSHAPLPVPDAKFPAEAAAFSPQTAIGGGPVLLKGGALVNSWKAELLYGDGADDKMPEARHPRSAVGLTKDGFLILFVCEGRGMTEGVAGLTFAEEASVLSALGCTEALNLDGGGSSCLLVEGKETIKVSDGAQRPVASVLILEKRP